MHPDAKIVWLGNSITYYWQRHGGHGYDDVLPVWNEYYAPYHALDFGFIGDTTSSLIWRLDNGQVAGLHPQLAIILIGANNFGRVHWDAAMTIPGIEAVVENTHERLPGAHILLLGVLPSIRSPWVDAQTKATNAALAQHYAENPTVTFMDIGYVLETNGQADPNLFVDPRLTPPEPALHPERRGHAAHRRHAGAGGAEVCEVSYLPRAAATKARISSGDFFPGAVSTPEDTSTPGAPVWRDGLRHIARVEPARQQPGLGRAEGSEQRPIRLNCVAAGSCRPRRRLRLHHIAIRKLIGGREIRGTRHAELAPDRAAKTVPQRRHRGRGAHGPAGYPARLSCKTASISSKLGFTNSPTRSGPPWARAESIPASTGRDVTRRGREEHEAQIIRASLHRGVKRLGAIDPADLDLGHAILAAMAAAAAAGSAAPVIGRPTTM